MDDGAGDDTSRNWFDVQGDYRALLLRPRQMQWRIITPAAKAAARVRGTSSGTTEAEAQGGPLMAAAAGTMRQGARGSKRSRDGGCTAGTRRTVDSVARDAAAEAAAASHGLDETDVALQFDLPPGAYATMALREAIKDRPPTSTQRHIRFT